MIPYLGPVPARRSVCSYWLSWVVVKRRDGLVCFDQNDQEQSIVGAARAVPR